MYTGKAYSNITNPKLYSSEYKLKNCNTQTTNMQRRGRKGITCSRIFNLSNGATAVRDLQQQVNNVHFRE